MRSIGVLGGMGPEATNQFCSLITALTPATCDQEHIPVLCFNNARIPDRSAALLHDGADPLPELIASARMLEKAGVDFIVMPCNTAHYYYEALSRAVGIPLLNMVDETVRAVCEGMPRTRNLGLLATSGTVAAGVYSKPLTRVGYRLQIPEAADQERLVMPAIYAVKAGRKERAREHLLLAAGKLAGEGAEALIAGCSEISLALRPHMLPLPLINPVDILARAAVSRALAD